MKKCSKWLVFSLIPPSPSLSRGCVYWNIITYIYNAGSEVARGWSSTSHKGQEKFQRVSGKAFTCSLPYFPLIEQGCFTQRAWMFSSLLSYGIQSRDTTSLPHLMKDLIIEAYGREGTCCPQISCRARCREIGPSALWAHAISQSHLYQFYTNPVLHSPHSRQFPPDVTAAL